MTDLKIKTEQKCYYCEQPIKNDEFIPHWAEDGEIICDICQNNMGESL